MLSSINPGETINNSELIDIFKCSPQGGMRRSKKTNTLVLVSNHMKSLYEDRWEGNIFHYTGMGQTGNQTLSVQNKTVAESDTNSIEMHLFEVFSSKGYTYMGIVELAEKPYQEEQLDGNSDIRMVWVFPLKLKSNQKRIAIPTKLLKKKQEQREKNARKLSDNELYKRAITAKKRSAKRKAVTNTFERDPFVSEYTKRWAKGICQLCEKPAPFNNKNGEPHLHTHHIEWLSRGGDDTIFNTIALCPNCHDKMHILDSEDDLKLLTEKVKNTVGEI